MSWDYLQDVMEEFMISEFGNEELLHEQLRDLDGQIRELEQSVDKDWYAGYQCEEAVLRRISIMERLGYSRQDITDVQRPVPTILRDTHAGSQRVPAG